MEPRVSIIVPAYNAEKTIGRCIESICRQTYSDYELLVMDDGSSDNTAQILDQYAAEDSRIRVIHKENSGVSDTRNQALNLARGEFVQFLDADDWITPDATRLFVRTMEDNPTCDMVIADFYRVIGKNMAQKGDIEEERLLTRQEYADEMMKSPADFYYGVLWNKFYRRSLIEEYQLRMDTQLDWSEDFIFNMEYVLHTDRIYVLKAPVYYYVKTEGSLVAQGGASISRTVRMKLDVVEYYSNFYKDIYKEGGYLLRSPVIYSFLLNFAKDGSVNPVAPERRLGQERVDVRIDSEMEENPFALNFYEDRMLERSLERICKGWDLEETEVQVLLYLKLAGGEAAPEEMRSYTGLSASGLRIVLQKLVRKKLVERKKVKIGKKKIEEGDSPENSPVNSSESRTDKREETTTKRTDVRIFYGEASTPVQEALERAFRDIDEIRFRDFSKEEMAEYRRLGGHAARNVRTALGEG